MSTADAASYTRSLSEISEEESVSLSIDLVVAARRNLAFLRSVADSHWMHQKPTILEAIRRYDQLWMPLIADLTRGSTKPPIVSPPLDVQWVWFCHTLNPTGYRCYCESRFSKIIGKPIIFDDENEEYAMIRCKKIWEHRFPTEPFENEVDQNPRNGLVISNNDLFELVSDQRNLCRQFSDPYNLEIVYLIAAKQRYKGFIHIIQKFAKEWSHPVLASDILLMWLTHKSYPTVYASDVKELETDMEKIVVESMKEEDAEKTKMMWERVFDQPYEKAGTAVIAVPLASEPPFYWDVTYADVNMRYKPMVPRFLFEVCVSVKLNSNVRKMQGDCSREFLRFRMAKCYRDLKMDKPLPNFTSKSWQQALQLYCGFGTKEIIIELRRRGGRFSKGSTLCDKILFPWNDLLRAPSLTLGKEIHQRLKTITSITPPVQASYLLKCVPDRVTDDSGAMISDVILKMNLYRPQEGRWLSRTILDHASRECFVVRMRVASGFWRRGGEAPKAVKWVDRIIEIREGFWSYVSSSSSIGVAPVKVVGTATPKEVVEGYRASWSFSTGDELTILWDATLSISSLSFELYPKNPVKSMVKLLKGRQMQYQVSNEDIKEGSTEGGSFEEDDFVTIVRFLDESEIGKATALLNWKLLVVELLPEEDAVLALLICLSILRSVSEMRREDLGNLLVRRRIREAKAGDRDWGSVILHRSACSQPSSPYLQPWYWNAKLFMTSSQEKDQRANLPAANYSQAEGGDKLYKSSIIP